VFFVVAFAIGALDRDLLAQIRRRQPAKPVDLAE
jgi:putative peptidoglycan lipid II flippase